jgi:outer membrane protein assembly factor BamB
MKRRGPGRSLLAVLSILIGLCGCSKFGSSVRAQNAAPPLEFLGAWGTKGDAPGQLDDPVGIATDNLGNVYVTDEGSRYIHKFAANGTPLLSFQEDPLKHPQGIAVDFEGVIYVTDPARAGVFIFLPDDEHHHELRLKTRGNAENSMSIAVDDDGAIYVLDAHTGKVLVYSSRLRLEKSWSPAAKGDEREHWYSMELGADRSLYFADPSVNHLVRYSGDGQLLGTVAPPAEADPKISDEFAVSHDYIFVIDANGTMLHIWTIDGKPKLDVDLAPQLGRERGPAPAIAFSLHKELFVLDSEKCRVLRYRVNF